LFLLLAAFVLPAAANEENMDMGNMDMGNMPASDHAATTSEGGHSMEGQVNWLVIGFVPAWHSGFRICCIQHREAQ